MARSTHWLLAACAALTLSLTSAQAEVLVAVAGPLSGQNISLGEQVHRGAQLAVADLNAKGGVLGQQIRLLVGDDACDPDQAAAVAKKLVADGAVFVVGHVCSHSSIPASKVYEEAGVVMISPASTNPRLTDEGGPLIFRVVGRDDEQGRVAGDYLADKWGTRKIAILHDNSTYGQGLAEETKKQLNSRGIGEALYADYVPGLIDYSELVASIGAASIDVIYVGGYSAEAGLILREARDQGLQVQLVGGDSLTTEEFWLTAGPAGEGTLMTFGPDPRRNPEAAEVVGRLRAESFEPEGYTLFAYGAVQAWAQAAGFAGELSPEAVSDALRTNRFNTVLGEIGFDENGDVTAPGYVWYRWTNGDYLPLD